MDIKLGKFSLTKNQIKNAPSLVNQIIKGLSFFDSFDVVAVCARELTPEEKHDLTIRIQALPDTIPKAEQDIIDFKAQSPLYGVTPAQAEQWIETNVKDLPSAKDALKKLARLLAFINSKVGG